MSISLHQDEVVVKVEQGTIRIPAASLNSPRKFQAWSRRNDWIGKDVLDELWHFCALHFSFD